MVEGREQGVGHGIYEDAALLDVCSPLFANLYRLWDGKRSGRRMPARADLDPVDLKPWLGRVTLLDVLPGPPMDFRYRLCGTRTVQDYGIDRTGHLFSEGVYIGTAETAISSMAEFVRRGKVRYRNDPIQDVKGYAVTRERIYLPLSDDDVAINMILCYQESKILVHQGSRR